MSGWSRLPCHQSVKSHVACIRDRNSVSPASGSLHSHQKKRLESCTACLLFTFSSMTVCIPELSLYMCRVCSCLMRRVVLRRSPRWSSEKTPENGTNWCRRRPRRIQSSNRYKVKIVAHPSVRFGRRFFRQFLPVFERKVVSHFWSIKFIPSYSRK